MPIETDSPLATGYIMTKFSPYSACLVINTDEFIYKYYYLSSSFLVVSMLIS